MSSPKIDRTESTTASPKLTYGLCARVVAGPSEGLAADIPQLGLWIGTDPTAGLVVKDARVSRRHLELVPHPAGATVRDFGSTNGTYVSGVRITEAVVPPGAILTIGDSEIVLEPTSASTELPVSTRDSLCGLIGRSIPMRALYTVLERAAPTDYTVLIEGATGTGKEVAARAVHELSLRRGKPFVVFDCSATASTLLESELFGHVRGAFTGAIENRDGAFRAADTGTLFIDEVNSLPLELQAKLLRALESRKVRPVGADRELPVDIRVVVATNRPLHAEVSAGRFREDLFYRLCVVRVTIPPLRERAIDIPVLASHFLRAAGNTSPVEGPGLARLTSHDWPGNVRELRNAIERALALAGSPQVPFARLPISVGDTAPLFAWPLEADAPFKEAKDAIIAAFERQYITQLLKASTGSVTEAAARSGLSRRHFSDLAKKYGLLPKDDLPDAT